MVEPESDQSDATPLGQEQPGGGVQHRDSLPGASLSAFVRRVLTSESEEHGSIDVPVPPTGSIYLNALVRGGITFTFSGGQRAEAPRLYFGGQLVRELPLARLRPPLMIVGLEFKPTGLHRLLGIDASRLTDRMTPVGDVDAELERLLREALAGLEDAGTCARAMQGVLGGYIPRALETPVADRAVAELEAAGGRRTVGDLAGASNVTARHLRRIFGRQVGVPPKIYAKTVQINRVVATMQSGESGAMHDLALEHGYYDQAHFIRDFRRAIGTNPTAFLDSADPFLEMYLGRNPAD